MKNFVNGLKPFLSRTLPVFALVAALGMGCASDRKKTATGAGIGAAGGAAIGAIAGGSKGALIGAGLGAVAGGVVGNRMDNQARELGQVAETKRTDEGILVNLKNDLLFPTGSSKLTDEARTQLVQLSQVLVKYPTNHIVISGHTDSMGASASNTSLSEFRARAVESVLVQNNVKSDQIKTQGYGESQPVATNATTQGRSKNRRVELYITDTQASNN